VLRSAIRSLGESLVRLYYPDMRVTGEPLPAAGPVIFVANHPNGLLDPLVLRVAAGRPVRFLAKSTLFGSPLGKLAMEAFGSVPVYRAQDAQGGAGGDRGAANERTFARCRALLAEGEAIALFPEGTSHSDPSLRPLKTGAARIALSAERERLDAAGAPLGLAVVPVGLAYQSKATFRSRVLLVVGKALRPAEHLEGYARDERGTADTLTHDIRVALDEVVLQAESRDLLEGVARVAAWTDPAAASDPAARHRRVRDMLAAYKALRERAPEQVDAIVRAAREYARILQRLGVRHPWALELQRVAVAPALLAVARLVLAAPIALLGAVLGWVPYRLTGRVAARVTHDEDVLGTVKLLGGALFLALGWAIEGGAVGWAAGWRWGLATALAGPASGYVALRFGELWGEMTESLRNLWLRGAHFDQMRRLSARRQALADDVARALESVQNG
jgi:1-acyl-sn-glycerol-3-phosphate acyltransferase